MNKIWKILIVFSLLLMPTSTMAAEDGEMSIYPASWDGENELTKYWYIYSLDKGDSHQDQVVVENTGGSPLSVKIYAVDALTTSDGAFALENEDEEKNDIGAWVTLSESELDLAAGESQIVDFTISIPEDTEPGEHIGGIVIENKTIKEGQQLNLKTRVGVRIYETVPGEVVKKVAIDNVQVNGYYSSIWSLFYTYDLNYDLVNEGNVQLSPSTDVSINSPWFGYVEASVNDMIDRSIFPGKKISPQQTIDDPLYFGPYTLTITTQLEEGAPVQKVHNFWVLPWKALLLVAIVLIGLISWVYSTGGKKEEESKPKKKGNKKAKKKTTTKKRK